MTEGIEIIREQVAEAMLCIKSKQSATDAIMYLRTLVGTDFDETFHQIAKRIGTNLQKHATIDH
jgi:hypothetical protein